MTFAHVRIRFWISVVACIGFAFDLGAAQEAVITEWPHGRKAALSVCFYDCMPSQLEKGAPVFREFNLPATFMVTPNSWWFVRSKDQWLALLDTPSFEFGNQTMNQSALRDIEDAWYEIGRAAEIIRSFRPHPKPIFFKDIEYELTNEEVTDEIFARIFEKYNLFTKEDNSVMLLEVLNSIGLSAYLDQVANSEKWHVLAVHGVGEQAFYKSIPLGEFRSAAAALAHRAEKDLWLANLGTVQSYQQLRTNAKLVTKGTLGGDFSFMVEAPSKFCLPGLYLTVRLDLPQNRQFDSNASSGYLNFKQLGRTLFFEVSPNHSPVRIVLQ